jgi:hypothetical protein
MCGRWKPSGRQPTDLNRFISPVTDPRLSVTETPACRCCYTPLFPESFELICLLRGCHSLNTLTLQVTVPCGGGIHRLRLSIQCEAELRLQYVPIRILYNRGKNPDSLCSLVVRVHGYRSRGPRFDSRRYQIF